MRPAPPPPERGPVPPVSPVLPVLPYLLPVLFPGTTALITGASRGIGAALAAAFAARGADLVLTARDRDALEQAAAPLRQAGRRVAILTEDLSDPAAPGRLVAELESRGLVVDHLVNNAGISTVGLARDADPDAERAVLQVNAVTPVELGVRLLPGMVARRRGGILNVASTSAFQGMPWVTAYGASKALLLSWSQGVHAELEGSGVRCTVVCPGPVDTGFFERNGQGRPPRITMVTPERVARVALRAYERNRSLAITGHLARLGAWATRLAPRAVAARVAEGYARPGGLGRKPA